MKSWHVTILGDRYPTTFVVKGSGWRAAAGRAVGEWQKKFKGSRTTTLSIRITKGV